MDIYSTFQTFGQMPLGPDSLNAALGVVRTTTAVGRLTVYSDSLTNRTSDYLPVSVAHRVKRAGEVRVCGRLNQPYWGDPANPTLWVGNTGLVWLDDASRCHCVAGKDAGGNLALMDQSRVLAPRETQVMTWATCTASSYWAFADTLRDVFAEVPRLEGPPAWLRLHHGWTDAQIQKHAQYTGCAYLVCEDVPAGPAPHGLDLLAQDLDALHAEIQRRKKLLPNARHLVYFDFGFLGRDQDRQQYADARQLGPQLQPLSADGFPLFVPTASNRYGLAMTTAAQSLLTATEADGLFIDLSNCGDASQPYTYGTWDGVSGDVSPTNQHLDGRKASVALLSRDFRNSLISGLQAQGYTIVCNGAPWTSGPARVSVVECGREEDYPSCHLTSPFAYLRGSPRNEDEAKALGLAAFAAHTIPVEPWDIDFPRTHYTTGEALIQWPYPQNEWR